MAVDPTCCDVCGYAHADSWWRRLLPPRSKLCREVAFADKGDPPPSPIKPGARRAGVGRFCSRHFRDATSLSSLDLAAAVAALRGEAAAATTEPQEREGSAPSELAEPAALIESVIDSLERLVVLDELTVGSVAGVLDAEFVHAERNNPNLRCYDSRPVTGPWRHVEVCEPRASGRFARRVVLTAVERCRVELPDITARLGDGEIVEIIPNRGPEGTVTYRHRLGRASVSLSYSYRSSELVDAVVQLQ